MSSTDPTGEKLRGPLTRWLSRQLPKARALRVGDLRRPGAGESSETWLFDLTWLDDAGEHALEAVLRCAPSRNGPFPSYDLGMQFNIMRALGTGTDVPVPEVLWLEEQPEVLGVPFLTMKAVDGEAPLDFPTYHGEGCYADAGREGRRTMWRSTIEVLVRLHDADWRGLGLDSVPGGGAEQDARRHALVYWRRYLDDWIKDDPSETIPVFDEAIDWLESERPEPERVALCWGDAKLGNVLYRRDTHEVAAMLDWELATIGDPEADLASLRISDLRAQEGAGGAQGGTPSEAELIELYERASGRRVRSFHYQLVFSAFWRGAVALKVMRRMRFEGAEIDDALIENHFPIRYMRELLSRSER